MKTTLLLVLGFALLPSCSEKPVPKSAIRLQHVLIAFKEAVGFRDRKMPEKARSRTVIEGENLAADLLKRAQSGDDFDSLIREFSEDSGSGTYDLYEGSEDAPEGYYRRSSMAKSFGDIGFSLQPGEVGLATYHNTNSPFGWHIIKRVK